MTKEELIKLISNDEGFEKYLNSVRAEGIQMAIDNLKALDASPYAIHSLECKLHGLRAGEPS